MQTDGVVYDGQPGQPSLVHTDSVVYDGQSGKQSSKLSGGKRLTL